MARMFRWVYCASLLVVAACNVDPFHLAGKARDAGGGGGGADGSTLGDAGEDAPPPDAPDAGDTDGCVPTAEVCDNRDNDCDGVVDNGFDKENDPNHCGACGMKCTPPANTNAACVAGQCEYTCQAGWVDLTPATPGCDYACIPSNGSVEACDFLDNDCDGEVDEGIPKNTNENCGSCGTRCALPNATASCATGRCELVSCHADYNDISPDVPGCEYRCPVRPPQDEACNSIDDDCDGRIDEMDQPGDPGIPSTSCGNTVGECSAGQTTCVFGQTLCVGGTGPTAEVCDGKDNNCDGQIDETFSFSDDEENCGGCGIACDAPHAVVQCVSGQCQQIDCQAGWVDTDPSTPGCDYECVPTGPEVCDGKDNDCDRLTDTADPDLEEPSVNFCNQNGECAGTTPTCRTDCDGKTRWVCFYDAADPTTDVEADGCGRLITQETLCDGKDNDCDNAVDEPFANKGRACTAGLGVCQGTGVYVCKADKSGTECNAVADPSRATPEACNGLDDNCDGQVDEGGAALDEMVYIADGNFSIYKYEASRPDATASSAGTLNTRPCSRPGVLPWSLVDWTSAKMACESIGLRLCTAAEWERACAGSAGLAYPYGNAYDGEMCNGRDADPVCATPENEDQVGPTGSTWKCSAPSTLLCSSADGVVDMSGNLKEWTGTLVSGSNPPAYYIRGGAYDNVRPGLTCQYDFISAGADYEFRNLGFRCCKTGM